MTGGFCGRGTGLLLELMDTLRNPLRDRLGRLPWLKVNQNGCRNGIRHNFLNLRLLNQGSLQVSLEGIRAKQLIELVAGSAANSCMDGLDHGNF